MIKGMLLTLAVIALFFGLIATTVVFAVAIAKAIIVIVEYLRGLIHERS